MISVNFHLFFSSNFTDDKNNYCDNSNNYKDTNTHSGLKNSFDH